MDPDAQGVATRLWQRPEVRRRAILLGLWAAIAVTLVAFRAVLLPFVGAALLAYVIEPVVRWLTGVPVRGRHLPRFAAVGLLYLALFGVLYVLGLTAVPRLYREVQRLSRSAQSFLTQLDDQTIETHVHRVEGWLVAHDLAVAPTPAQSAHAPVPAPPPSRQVGAPGGEPQFTTPRPITGTGTQGLTVDLDAVARDLVARASKAIRDGVFEIARFVQRLAGAVVQGLFYFGLMLMVTAFLSIDVKRVMAVVHSLVPVRLQGDADSLIGRIDAGLSGVVRGQLTIMLINGTLTFVGLWIFGVKFTVLLGLVATVLYLVPIFGTIFSSVPIFLVALADSPSKALAILLWILGLHLLESYYLNPRVLGDAAKIHPVLIVFALIAGERVGGVVGVLLAVPAMSVALAVFRFAHRRAVELGELPPLKPGAPAGD